MNKNTQKIIIGAIVGIGAIAGYWLYKNRFPTFSVLEINNLDKTVRFRYGSKVYFVSATQNETFYDDATENYAVNISPIEEGDKITGMNFHFLGKDTRPPQYLYFAL
ncbi:MAG: hypothetical protein NZ551_00970 [Microscillaceae bacterium]|nr:hypothetical protein [Microscillaceae bacterium]MDW8459760.1 hypothetical protein [Cytophagales bacterium]